MGGCDGEEGRKGVILTGGGKFRIVSGIGRSFVSARGLREGILRTLCRFDLAWQSVVIQSIIIRIFDSDPSSDPSNCLGQAICFCFSDIGEHVV